MKVNIKLLYDEVSKCVYCGFCEAVCPTINLGTHRGYGPRGRVNLIKDVLENKIITEEFLASIYSCLLCDACYIVCPAKIDTGRIVRDMRSIIRSEYNSDKNEKIIIKER
ncbi:hypothetical protein Calag_0249 [Caldisphaera lagunensis DSM 15908]|uniref:4Fe-4S ferredoxin-type domain-containing protein n=1 Tax=Caldisphaera lagunensis (strain DSM 15908 / JCM 11604 / ANMR 0165 / IC-154) TaxID=1056495 RepID=L0A869_CALLD|nr:(Fe-S)-binding protein [Caldisphaera lagunensis]AFZ70031.1 hypothetical protein Calag_0249 [Caldisphaera lagunensis DSM 15908]